MESAEQVKLPKIPEKLWDGIFVDYEDLKLYSDKEHFTNPLMQSWIANCKIRGANFSWTEMSIDEVQKLKQEKGRGKDVSSYMDDRGTRNKAIDLLKTGAEYGASDIHMIINGKFTEIQFRIKGALKHYETWRANVGDAVIKSLYQGIATVRDSSFNPREFQNAQISGEEIAPMNMTSVRLVRGPSFPVEEDAGFCVMRLQYNEHHKPKTNLKRLEPPKKPAGQLLLDKMGYNEKQIELLLRMCEAPNGIIMFTGPTGSGKTTSLAQILTHLAREFPGKRQITMEDPVEYPLDWAVQMVVNNANSDSETGDAFANLLRVGLRMDPDTVLLGELRGPVAAKSAIDAALTGHLVLTTLHVTDPYLSVDRIEMMDNRMLPRASFCDHKIIRGIVAQRITPKLCQHCAIPLKGNEDQVKPWVIEAISTYVDDSEEFSMDNIKLTGGGCDHCGGDGISGRMAVAEVVLTDSALMKNFIHQGTDVARKEHRTREDTDNSMMVNAVHLCLKGIIDPREVSNIDMVLPKGEEDK